MFARGLRHGIWLALLCAGAFAAPVMPSGSERVAVSREQIAGAMQSAGIDATADQLQLLSNVTSLAGARLRVARVKRQAGDTALAELNCQERQCLPFYVLVHDAHIADGGAIAAPPSSKPAETHPLIRRGSAMTLLIENADFRIVLPVVSLESGAQGQVITVTSPDRKRTYRAEIVNGTTVRSAL